jgi:hypothetical protein
MDPTNQPIVNSRLVAVADSTLKEDVDDGDTTANVGSNLSSLPSYGRTGNGLDALDSLGEGNYAVDNNPAFERKKRDHRSLTEESDDALPDHKPCKLLSDPNATSNSNSSGNSIPSLDDDDADAASDGDDCQEHAIAVEPSILSPAASCKTNFSQIADTREVD